jgi:transposase
MSHTDPATVPTPITAEQLPDDRDTLKRMILELLETLQENQRDREQLQHRLDLLLQRLYGPRQERIDPNQRLLFPETTADAVTAVTPTAPAAEDKPKRKCKPHGRRRIPENLPRVPVHYVLTEAERTCSTCGNVCNEIGTEKSEQLDYKPASLFVVEHVVHKYACPCCSKAQQQSSPPQGAVTPPVQEPTVPAPQERAATPGQEPAAPLTPETAAMPEPEPTRTCAVQPQPVTSASESTPVQEQTATAGTAPLPQETTVLPGLQPNRTPESAPQPVAAVQEQTPAQEQMAAAVESPQVGQPGVCEPLTLPAAPPRQPPPLAGVVIAATKPAMPIAKGLPRPGLLAHLIVSKYTDHLPLNRLQHIYDREGFFLHRSTLCDWMAGSAHVLRPLYGRLVRVVLLSRSLHTDDTPVDMQDPRTHVRSEAHLWGYLGDAAHPYNVFDFTINRKRDGPVKFLAGYQGYLHADAFSGYDCLYLPDPLTTQARIIEVACNAHARRKYYEARTTDALRSHQALAYYGQLYELERKAKDFSDTQRLQIRQELSVPILDKFQKWQEDQIKEVLPKSPLAEALGYTRNHWTALVRYTEAGFLDIDNNVAEREMKRIAIGRKNWLFVGSEQGGHTAAVLMSFTSSCYRLGVEPWAYLQDVLTRLPTTPPDQLDNLLPDRWKAARAVTAKAESPAAPTSPGLAAPPREYP